MTIAVQREQTRVAPRRHRILLEAYLYVAPAALLVGTFLLYPAGYTLYISLTQWDGLNAPTFVGLHNYREMLLDPAFRTSLQNTMIWVIGTLLLPVLLGLVLASTITRVPFERVYKFIFYLPYAVSATSAAVIWGYMLDPNGVINTFLRGIGVGSFAKSWLVSPPWNTITMILAYSWLTTGTNMVLFLVGLQAIPSETVEAARLDGANRWQEFWHIIFPQLRPITTVVVALALANSFKVFDLIWVMTQGGPYRSSETLAVTMYRESFVLFRLGYGAAIAVVLSIIVLVVSAVYIRAMFRREER